MIEQITTKNKGEGANVRKMSEFCKERKWHTAGVKAL
jgi:hypothetical protein